MLAWTIYLSFLGTAGVLLLPEDKPQWARRGALAFALLGAAVAVAFAAGFTPNRGFQTFVDIPWVKGLGIHYSLGVDGVSLVLVLLTSVAAVAGVLFSWDIEHRAREFFALYLLLIGCVYGVFLSVDLFLFFVFYELAIIPKYFLIAIWGSTRREYGAMKLVLYSFAGSALVLGGVLAAYAMGGGHELSVVELPKLLAQLDPATVRAFQMWAFPVVFVGFAVLAGLWPFHTWAPTGHVAAPTAASMLLAGVIMKLGAYGAFRVAMGVFPLGLAPWRETWLGFHSWPEVFAALAVAGILFGALAALVQRDFKFVIGYSSVSHMGFVLLGLMTLHVVGLNGAVLQMFSHGVIAGLLFAVVGRMVYARTHTRELSELRGLSLRRALPFAAATFALAGFASMGLPGFSGFVAELQVLIGAWQAFPTFAALTGVGIVIGVAYVLRALQQTFLVDDATPMASHTEHPLPAITWPERVGAGLLLGATLLVGLQPALLLDWIAPAVSGWLNALPQGGVW